MEKEPRESYKEKNGTSRVGDALRWLTDSGVKVAPALLEMASLVTGREGFHRLANAVRGDESITGVNESYVLNQIEADISDEVEKTKRWEADMKSGSWLAQNIRPLVVANFTLLIDVVIITSQWGRPLGEAYLPLLMTMGVTAIGGYFTLREYGKTKK